MQSKTGADSHRVNGRPKKPRRMKEEDRVCAVIAIVFVLCSIIIHLYNLYNDGFM
jgi:hypothetical protein